MLKSLSAKWQTWRRNRLVRYSANLLVLFLVVVAIRAYTMRDMSTGMAPQIHSTTLSNQVIDLHRSEKHPILLYFWASWCSICKLSQENIDTLSKEYNVITVAMQSGDRADVQAYMQKNNLSYRVINDPDGIISKSYGIRGVPASFIIDKKNQIRFAESGYTTAPGLRLRLWLAQ